MKVSLVEYNLLFLELSWSWLNDPQVKKLTNTPDFSKEDQLSWFNSLKTTTTYKVWGVLADEIPIGVAGLKRINDKTADVFWYIGNKDYWSKGCGTMIAKQISEKASEIGLIEIYADSIVENYKSINLLFKENYQIVGFENCTYRLKKKLKK